MPNRMRETVTVMAAAIFVVFIPASTIAQNAADHKPKHKQYKLIDLGTVGGPNRIIFGATGPLNN
jgi:hypothetical protein